MDDGPKWDAITGSPDWDVRDIPKALEQNQVSLEELPEGITDGTLVKFCTDNCSYDIGTKLVLSTDGGSKPGWMKLQPSTNIQIKNTNIQRGVDLLDKIEGVGIQHPYPLEQLRGKVLRRFGPAQPPRDSVWDGAGTWTATSTLLQHEPPKHKRQDRTTSRRPETPIKLLWKKCQMKIISAPDCMDPVNLAHVHLKELLEVIQDGSQILDPTPETATEHSLNQLNYKDFPALHRATASLSVKRKDKKLDVFFRARITAMVDPRHKGLTVPDAFEIGFMPFSTRKNSLFITMASIIHPFSVAET
ncbi:hypothetical protein DFH07DRAFT_770177 [Mycena maculata]|uniref:Uncharacterized protein n=1 Tax=Mycena maculata TaxID=230809 RepID=A0AAD7JIG0_9AGAR|nr:hypothetical protein DFH07DRAFT_770177 [Mycena maculata]